MKGISIITSAMRRRMKAAADKCGFSSGEIALAKLMLSCQFQKGHRGQHAGELIHPRGGRIQWTRPNNDLHVSKGKR